MRPNLRIVRLSEDNKRDKKMLCFLVDPLLYEHCVKSKRCQLIQEGSLVESNVSGAEGMAALAVELWRLEKRLNNVRENLKSSSGQDADAVFDQLQRIKDFLIKQEIETKEYKGENYNDGLSVRPHFEVDNNLPKGAMKIIETVKPSVYFKGKIMIHGDVVVARAKEN